MADKLQPRGMYIQEVGFYDGSGNPVAPDVTAVAPDAAVTALTIAENAYLSDAFDFGGEIGISVYVPGAWTAANIGFKTSDTLAGTYDIALDKTGVPIQITTVNTGRAGWYSVPTEIFMHKYIKLWSKSTVAATETDVNQAAARAMKVMLK